MLKKIIESALLLGAVALLIPIPPSDPSRIDFMPVGAAATLIFLGSRVLRHAGSPLQRALFSGSESVLFLGVAYLVNQSANILLATHS